MFVKVTSKSKPVLCQWFEPLSVHQWKASVPLIWPNWTYVNEQQARQTCQWFGPIEWWMVFINKQAWCQWFEPTECLSTSKPMPVMCQWFDPNMFVHHQQASVLGGDSTQLSDHAIMPEIWPNWMYVKASPCQWFDFDPIECLSFVSKQDLASDVWCAIQSTPSSVHCPSSMNNEMFVNRQECRSTCNHARMPVMCQWWFDPRIICPSTCKHHASNLTQLNVW